VKHGGSQSRTAVAATDRQRRPRHGIVSRQNIVMSAGKLLLMWMINKINPSHYYWFWII
jgi:hypothetical protein